MKIKRLLSALFIQLLCAFANVAQDKEKECDDSKFKAFRIDHDNDLREKRISPEYPAIIKEAKIQGAVFNKVLVNREGDVMRACVLEGHPVLGDAAKKAAMEWKFKASHGFSPNNKTVPEYRVTVLTFNFNLN